MLFKKYKIAPEGRNRYGNYVSNQNMAGNITYATYAGNETTNSYAGDGKGQGGTTTTPPVQKTYIMFLTSTQGNFEGAQIAQATQTAKTQVVSYVNSTPTVAFIGDFDESTSTGISGATAGMMVNVVNNCTTAVTVEILITSALTNPTGTLLIPCYMPTNGDEPGTAFQAWETLHNQEGALYSQILEWNWSVSSDATSAFVLDLTNEMAGVNCDSDGKVLSGATLPSTQAKLYYGDTQLSAVTYSAVVPPAYHASGVVFDSSTGILSFTSDLAFESDAMQITINAIYGGQTRSKVFTLMKNLPGKDGTPATTTWIVPSANQILYNPDSSAFTPSQITFEVWRQTGGQQPEIFERGIYVKVLPGGSWQWYGHGSAITITDSAATMVQLAILDGEMEPYEVESIPVLRNGARGEQGEQGPAGPSVRGPFDWYSGITSNRRFCNGKGPNESDKLYIDILLKDHIYYKCKTSYDATPTDTWASVSSNWASADTQYNFVATNLLLADNAKINMLTNNGLLLIDSGGTVTGGAQGGSGNDIAFWAGSSSPSSGAFKVDHDGNLSAETGTFGGYIKYKYELITSLNYNTARTAYYTYSGSIARPGTMHQYIVHNSTANAHTWSSSSDIGDYSALTFDYAKLVLMEPSADWNGLMYDIIVPPNITKTQGTTALMVSATNIGRYITVYSGNRLFSSPQIILLGGRFEFVCVPTGGLNTYMWMMSCLSGSFICGDQTLSTVFGSSFIGWEYSPCLLNIYSQTPGSLSSNIAEVQIQKTTNGHIYVGTTQVK